MMTDQVPAAVSCPYALQLEDAVLRLHDGQAAMRVAIKAVTTRHHDVRVFSAKFLEANPGVPLPDGATGIVFDPDTKAFRRGQLDMQHRAAEALLKSAGPDCGPELRVRIAAALTAVLGLEVAP